MHDSTGLRESGAAGGVGGSRTFRPQAVAGLDARVVRLACGLTLILEPQPGRPHAAIHLATPAGTGAEPGDRQGLASILAEVAYRGAGELDSRAFNDRLDELGVQRTTSVSSRALHVGASAMREALDEALPLLLDMVRRPRLVADVFEPARALARQDLEASLDEPEERLLDALIERAFPPPWNRSTLGREAGLAAATLGDLERFVASRCVPGGTVLAVVGGFDPQRMIDRLERWSEGWGGVAAAIDVEGEAVRGEQAIAAPLRQTHLAMSFAGPAAGEPDEDAVRVAVEAASGGVAGVLFERLREARGLCYQVSATQVIRPDRGLVYTHLATRPGQADTAREAVWATWRDAPTWLDEDRLSRAKVGLRSRWLAQAEMTAARAGWWVGDWLAGRPLRPVGEHLESVFAVTRDAALAALASRMAEEPITSVTLGPSGEGDAS